jgi:hypothetical protein
VALEEQYGALPLPFAGMDSKYLVNVILMWSRIYLPCKWGPCHWIYMEEVFGGSLCI